MRESLWSVAAFVIAGVCLRAPSLAAGVPVSPIPDKGPVPAMVDDDPAAEKELSHRAKQRQYERQVTIIAHKHFGSVKVDAIRQEGIQKLKEFTDPASFRPMFDVLKKEKDDIRLAMLDHFASRDEQGHAALAHVAIHADDAPLRHEAAKRIPTPISKPVLRELDKALRSPKHLVANNAGSLAGILNAVEAIPLLIFAQATRDAQPAEQGDLAWIAIQTTTVYVANVTPVVGDNSGGFAPVLGVLREGVLMRVQDAFVINYRMDVHNSLVNMANAETGENTEPMGYNMREWWAWYNKVFVPKHNAKVAAAEAANGAP
jgi:hypothetical protein